jgi:uncharacterized membrane protein
VGFGGLSALALPASLLVGIILLVRWLGGPSTGPGREAQEKDRVVGDPALETLRRRYAAGEVSQEEYKTIRQDLAR